MRRMLPKPYTCVGCPMYGDGMGFVPDAIDSSADVQVVAQNPGADEEVGSFIIGWEGKHPIYAETTPQPLIGRTGWETRRYMKVAGVEKYSRSNILKCRMIVDGKRTNKLPTGKMLDDAIEHCSQHFRWGAGVKYVLAMGAVAWKALGGKGSITQWRGFRIVP